MTTIDQQPRLKEVLTRVLTIALSSLIVAVNLSSFVAAGDLFPGGFTGITRLSERKNVDAWNYILCGNVVLLAIAGCLFGWEKALYSILFQYATTQVIKALDPDGRRATLLIVTGRETAGGVCAQIQETNHTATLIEGVGLYNGDPCVMIYSVVNDGEVRSLARKIRMSDPKAFVNVLRTQRVVGKFYRRPRD